MFKEYDTFRLAKQIPGESISTGAVGVVLMVHEDHVYEVEFCDANGMNIGSKATFTVTDDYMIPDRE